MRLETIAKTYGMVDYFEPQTGYIYQLSKATPNEEGTLTVPVIENGMLIGTTKMEKVK